MTPPDAAIEPELHHEVVDTTRARRPRVLMVVANPSVSATTGWPVGFWAAELFHPLHEFTKVRYEVTVASPEGGKVEIDAMSDPRDESRWSADDVISMGSLHTPEIAGRLERKHALRDLELDAFDALVVCGGQGPMFQFRDHEELKGAIARTFEAEKPTAALCHGVSALIDVTLSDGSYQVQGRTLTGFANVEEDYSVDRWRGDGGTGRIAARRPSEYRRYLEQPYDAEVIQPLRESLERLLANRAASLLWVAWPAGGSCGS